METISKDRYPKKIWTYYNWKFKKLSKIPTKNSKKHQKNPEFNIVLTILQLLHFCFLFPFCTVSFVLHYWFCFTLSVCATQNLWCSSAATGRLHQVACCMQMNYKSGIRLQKLENIAMASKSCKMLNIKPVEISTL